LPTVSLPLEPFSLSAPVLGLLLVFRTNSAFGRYQEARMVWGDVINRTRDLMRQTITWFKFDDQVKISMRLIPAYAVALRCMLRSSQMRDDVTFDLRNLLALGETQEMLSSGVPPAVWIMQRLSWVCEESGMTEIQARMFHDNITELVANIGKCERIFSTPVPLMYSRHTTRFLMIYLGLLPLALYAKLGWEVIPTILAMSFFYLGIEDLGVQIEEPFRVLPLDKYSAKVETEARKLSEMSRGHLAA